MSLRCPLALIALLPALLLAGGKSSDLVQNRQQRLDRETNRMQEAPRVTINVHYRVPVVEAYGYFAAYHDDTDKLNELLTRLQPVSKRVIELAGQTFSGRDFPPSVDQEMQQLRDQLDTTIIEIYGDAIFRDFVTYLEARFYYLDRGVFGPIID